MQVYTLDEVPHDLGATSLALGLFDGVHAGHLALLARVREEAEKRGISPSVLTFDDDPALKAGTPRLTTLSERLDLFSRAGMENCFVASFPAVRDLSPEEFVGEILFRRLRAEVAVAGFNFRFGRNADGDAAMLESLFARAGKTARTLPPARLSDGTVISSSAVRDALTKGDLARAEALLGRPYSLTAPVHTGKALGRTIGFPTVNQLFPAGKLVPRYGVYGSEVAVGDRLYPGVTNIGVRPTVSGEGVTCETHLIGFTGDLYGETLTVSLRAFLRPEERFDSLGALTEQITKDKERVEKLWQENGHA
ncbi:MAG: riboflavin biosynthesis protein RibF [Eubacteriales bacterium]